MPTTCYSVLRGKRIRVTKLDACGNPPDALTAASQVTSSGMITVQYALVYEDPTEYLQKNADDDLCVNQMGKVRLKRVEFTLSLCQVDPDLFTALTGQPVEVDNAGNNVGYRLAENVEIPDFAFEHWSGIAGEDCDEAANVPYGYFLMPRATNGRLNDFTIENGVVNFEITGHSANNSGWGQGPYNVVRDANGVCTALDDPILPLEHFLKRLTTCPPPAAVCGLQAMPAAPVLPS